MPDMTTREAVRPEIGALVSVRDQRWVVSEVEASDQTTLVGLQSVEDGRYGDTLEVIWEIEPGRRVLPSGSLPEVTAADVDRPATLAAAPLRSGVDIEDHQLEPVARAVDAPR